jgi:uncharacterized phosphosugar-binding protein
MMLPYFDVIRTLLTEAEAKNAATLAALSETVADNIAAGGILHLFGTGHGHMLAEELFYRAGGLVPVNAILDPILMLHESALSSSLAERLPGYAEVVLSRYQIEPGETIIIASNSGRNSVPIEMAIAARARGLHVAALTSLAHANAHPSRHPSGKHLHELADFVLDNCGVVGDAALPVEGISESVAPTSTVIGVALLQSLVYAVTTRLVQANVEPPIFISANVENADEHNARLMERYRARLRHL